MSKKLKTLFFCGICLIILGLAGCATTKRGGRGGHYEQGDGYTETDEHMRYFGNEQRGELKNRLSHNTYYFDYDRYDVNANDQPDIYANAEKIMNNGEGQVRIEGHTDNRGSREYNIALGLRRAKSVANLLKSKGVPDNRLNVVSYGKEKPAKLGDDESTWAENRRAAIVYESE